jgi:putative transposase
VLDALEQAPHARRPVQGGLVHHSDHGVRYVSITCTERLAEAGIGLFKTEAIRRLGPWRSLEAVGFTTLGLLLKAAASLAGLLRCCSQRVDWFDHRRLPEPIGFVPKAEAEAAF